MKVTVRPSRENCRKALSDLSQAKRMAAVGNPAYTVYLDQVEEFLAAAHGRLPSELALDNDRIRKRGRAKT